MTKGNLGDYVAICGGHLQNGALLQRIVFLYQKATLVIDGHLWYVQSRSELMAATGLTKNAYDKSIAWLIDNGFIERTYAGSFTKSNALRTTAFRVLEKTEVQLVAHLATTKTGKKQATGCLPVQATDGPQAQATGCPPMQATKKIISYSSSHSISHSAGLSATQGTGSKVSIKDVEKTYREAVKKFDPSYFHVSWGIRLKGIAKNLIKVVGPDKVLDVVTCCAQNWETYSEFVREQTTMKVPERPELFTLLTHAGASVQFMQKKQTMVSGKSKLKMQDL